MNKEDIKETIARTLEAINEEFRQISSRKDIIPHIEMDLIMENTRKLYENLLMLNKINEEKIKPYHSIETNNAKPAAREEITKEIKKEKTAFPEQKEETPEPQVRQAPQPPVQQAPQPSEQQYEKEKTELKKDESAEEKETAGLFKAESTADIEDKKAVSAAEMEEKKAEKHPKSISLGESFKSETPSLKDHLNKNGKSREPSLGEVLGKEPLPDLKSHISLNDKFIFMNELFGGKLNDYKESLDGLNACSSFDQALARFQELKNKFNMDDKLDSYHRFMDILRRRFAAS